MSSVAKSGGTSFHGSGFFYATNYVLNANDWLSNVSNQPRPQNKYHYPGGTFGGPLLIPGTRFSKSRTKPSAANTMISRCHRRPARSWG